MNHPCHPSKLFFSIVLADNFNGGVRATTIYLYFLLSPSRPFPVCVKFRSSLQTCSLQKDTDLVSLVLPSQFTQTAPVPYSNRLFVDWTEKASF